MILTNIVRRRGRGAAATGVSRGWTDTIAGEWFAVRSQRPRRARELSDARILGGGEFVERIPREADARALRQHAAKKGNRYAERVVAEECKKSGVSLTELRNGSGRGRLPVVRTKIARRLVENYGVAIAEVARQVGISTSGVSEILTRTLST
jgi:putative transposase